MIAKRFKKNGFTLVEWLLVVAITVVLAGLAARVVMRSRATAQTLLCLNNLKQIASALQMYRSDCHEIAPALSALKGRYITDDRILSCPADYESAATGADSYSSFYIPRPTTDTNKLFLGCPRHAGHRTNSVFGWPRFAVGTTGTVTWNGQPVQQGLVVEGGTLAFEDGTTVQLNGNLKVGVMLSLTDPEGRWYSAICIQEGDAGSLEVTHPAEVESEFEVITPSVITGVAGSRFVVTVETKSLDVEGEAFLVTRTGLDVTEGAVWLRDRVSENNNLVSAAGPALSVTSVTGGEAISAGVNRHAKPPRPGKNISRFPPAWLEKYGAQLDM